MRSFTLVFTPLQSPFRTVTTKNYELVLDSDNYVQSLYNSMIVAGSARWSCPPSPCSR